MKTLEIMISDNLQLLLNVIVPTLSNNKLYIECMIASVNKVESNNEYTFMVISSLHTYQLFDYVIITFKIYHLRKVILWFKLKIFNENNIDISK